MLTPLAQSTQKRPIPSIHPKTAIPFPGFSYKVVQLVPEIPLILVAPRWPMEIWPPSLLRMHLHMRPNSSLGWSSKMYGHRSPRNWWSPFGFPKQNPLEGPSTQSRAATPKLAAKGPFVGCLLSVGLLLHISILGMVARNFVFCRCSVKMNRTKKTKNQKTCQEQ